MKSIWKYPFQVKDSFTLVMPQSARILCVQTQYDTPCIWAMVDPDEAHEDRNFVIAPTGGIAPELPEETTSTIEYIGTFQMLDGRLVWHLFEVVPMVRVVHGV